MFEICSGLIILPCLVDLPKTEGLRVWVCSWHWTHLAHLTMMYVQSVSCVFCLEDITRDRQLQCCGLCVLLALDQFSLMCLVTS